MTKLVYAGLPGYGWPKLLYGLLMIWGEGSSLTHGLFGQGDYRITSPISSAPEIKLVAYEIKDTRGYTQITRHSRLLRLSAYRQRNTRQP